MNDSSIILDQLSKSFDHGKSLALNRVSASIKPGGIVGIVGPDGAGKTTLMRILAGLLKPTEGAAKVLSLDPVMQGKVLHHHIGYMPQRFGLYEDLSVMQNLRLYAELQGVDQYNQAAHFEHLLRFCGLHPFTKRLAKNLSGGMKQKLGLCCVLLKKPKVLLLDEPSVGVDPISRRELWAMVKSILDQQMTILWSTCYLDEAEKCDSILLLREAKLLYQGSPKDFEKRVENKVFLIRSQSPREKRELLGDISKNPEVSDCIIQGDRLRVVLKHPGSNETLAPLSLEPVDPRLEDAFVDFLGAPPLHLTKMAEKLNKDDFSDTEVIQVTNLTKSFDSFLAVKGINFNVKRGEIFGLLGPNGAGKSTTFKMLCGLLKPSSGTTQVMGFCMEKAPMQARLQIGYMSQKFSLYDDLSARQNLLFFAGIYGVGKKTRNIKIEEISSIFSLNDVLDVSTKDLPLGFKQRLALACCLLHSPKLLFLDEPTSGVDPLTRREFWGHINSLVSSGITVMITTHFMDEAEYCDRIGLINNGTLSVIGTPDELKKMVQSPSLPSPTLEDAFIHLSLTPGALIEK